MALADLLTQTVSVRPAGTTTTVDDEGNPTRPSGTPVTYRARLERGMSLADRQETDRGPVLSDTKWLLILPADAVVAQHDTVVADGTTFEVDGPPILQRTPRGVHHVEARLRLVTG